MISDVYLDSTALIAVITFLFGAIVGSFLNVCIARLDRIADDLEGGGGCPLVTRHSISRHTDVRIIPFVVEERSRRKSLDLHSLNLTRMRRRAIGREIGVDKVCCLARQEELTDGEITASRREVLMAEDSLMFRHSPKFFQCLYSIEILATERRRPSKRFSGSFSARPADAYSISDHRRVPSLITWLGLFAQVIGVDVDHHALRFAAQRFQKANLAFGLVDGTRLPFKDGQFDVITCTHIYEHVADPHKLLAEIRRVLKYGGACYFAAANRLWPIEFHYGLPFLARLPPSMANRYLKMCGKGNLYDVRLLTLGSLRGLVEGFSVVDYTPRIVEHPAAYHAEYMMPPGSLTHRLARLVLKYCYWLFPTYIWILIRR